MNRDEARQILQAYRPGGEDADDPYFADALAMVKYDPELAEWFAKQQAFDARISGSLRQVPVPSRFKAKILAQRKNEPAPTLNWWRQMFALQPPASWALAAVILMVFGLALFWNHSQPKSGFTEYSVQMVNAALLDQHHVDRDTGNLKAALASLPINLTESQISLPIRLDGGNGLDGCRSLAWHGQNVAMLCFSPAGGGHVDLFVTAAAIFTDAPPANHPRFAISNGTPTASWTHDGEVYLAVSHSDETVLKNLWSPQSLSWIRLKTVLINNRNRL
jgi:hypothetical protein